MADYMAAVAFGIDFGDEEIGADLKQAIRVPDAPAEILGYGVDFENWALVIKGSLIEGGEGSATEFETKVEPAAVARFVEWCKENGIEGHEPKWLLTVAIGC